MQTEINDCGIAALAIVLAYYGCYVPIEELRAHCSVSRDGTSIIELTKAAHYYGLKTDILYNSSLPPFEQNEGVFTRVPDQTRSFSVPMILFWNKHHFVVLEGFKGNNVFINDPKKGRHSISRSTFDAAFSGTTIGFSLTQQFRKRKKPKRLLKLVEDLLKYDRRRITGILVSALLLTLPSMAIPLFSKGYIDCYLTQTQENWMKQYFAIMLLTLIVQIIFSFFQQKTLRQLECDYAQKLSANLIHRLLQCPLIFFASRPAGDLSHRSQAAQSLAATLTGPICATLSSSLQLCVYLTMMFIYSPLLSLVAVAFSMSNVIWTSLSQEKRKQLTALTHHHLVDLTSSTTNYLAMIATIKAMGAEHLLLSKWQNTLSQYLQTYSQSSLTHIKTQSISFFLTSTAYAVTMGLGALQVTQGQLTLGELMAFNVLFFSFQQSSSQWIKLTNQFHVAQVNYQQISDITNYHNPNTNLPEKALPLKRHGKIEIVDLCFGYGAKDKPLFNKLNLTIEANSKIAILGASGSGKTTLVNLIAGLYSPWSGSILIDGVPLATIPAEQRAERIGVVSQDQFFFKASLLQNLTLWETTYTRTEVMDALKEACLEEFIMQLDDGLDFEVTEGATNLSGGQRQRFEIARTLLIKPDILIFDEATSALDPLIEQQIQNNLRRKLLTSITIAHRLSTIRNADTIYILQQGNLIDSGTHETLINKQSQAYLSLFNRHQLERMFTE